jgi:hypothetical protein
VETIIGEREMGRGKGKEFRLVWEGWAEEHNSWEPEENLIGCQTLIKDWREDSRARETGGTWPALVDTARKQLRGK